MSFTSQIANRDPAPYLCECGSRAYTADPMGEGHTSIAWTPRPEYDTPANPILVAARNGGPLWDADLFVVAFAHWDSFGGFRDWDEPTHPFHAFTTATPEQIAHARKVLTRLAALRGEVTA